jgi:hypothetical protein
VGRVLDLLSENLSQDDLLGEVLATDYDLIPAVGSTTIDEYKQDCRCR